MANQDVLREFAQIATDVGKAIVPAGHDELLRSIVESARRLFGAAACSLALLSDDGEELVFHVADGEGADQVVGLRISASQGIAGFVVQSGQPMAIEQVQRDPRFAASFAQETGYAPTSILAVPLQTEREILGVLEILDPAEDGPVRAHEMEIVGLFADQAALAIENSRVFRTLGRALLSAVARAVEAERPDLARALEQVAESARGPRAEMAEIASLFADIGEMGAEERDAAVRLLSGFVRYARSVRRMG